MRCKKNNQIEWWSPKFVWSQRTCRILRLFEIDLRRPSLSLSLSVRCGHRKVFCLYMLTEKCSCTPLWKISALHPQYRYIEWQFITRRRKIVYWLPLWTSYTCMFILPYASTRFIRQILLWNEAIKWLSCSTVIQGLLIAGLEKYDIPRVIFHCTLCRCALFCCVC